MLCKKNNRNEEVLPGYVGNTVSEEEMSRYWNILDKRVASNRDDAWIKYLHFGTKVIKLECRLPHLYKILDKQFATIADDTVNHYDTAICFWEDDTNSCINDLETDIYRLLIMCSFANGAVSTIEFFRPINLLMAYNAQTHTHYFSSSDMSKERIVDLWGEHLFVSFLNKVISDANTAVFHAAAIGIRGNGVLLCGRGGAGKSTLAVSALVDGFDFVSEDYCVFNKSDGLRAYPVYSTSSLSPEAIAQMNDLKYEFLNDNWNNTKYVVELAAYHDRFVKMLPIKAVFFPKICEEKKPSIEKISRGKVVAQTVHSTLLQLYKGSFKYADYAMWYKNGLEYVRHLTYSVNNQESVKHLMSFFDGLDCYQINLCSNLKANVDIMREFIVGLNKNKMTEA
ncbi:hypothetical protein FACS189449_00170 [Alphaproteobacteria bacterium]|nr:hypothetical protein FACS189449_00170 [Alphaproteobacteria bacterium]